jgi:hypothetical protein
LLSAEARVEVAPRQRRARVEAEKDAEVMRWIGRFRFVTFGGLSVRFGVSERNPRTRITRLEARRLVCVDRKTLQAASLYLTAKGFAAIGSKRRRAPRVDAQREHELAVVEQVARLERDAGPTHEILTERDCRTRQAGGLDSFHVTVRGDATMMDDRSATIQPNQGFSTCSGRQRYRDLSRSNANPRPP